MGKSQKSHSLRDFFFLLLFYLKDRNDLSRNTNFGPAGNPQIPWSTPV